MAVLLCDVFVPGEAIPQGSKRIGRHGTHPVILDANDAKLAPWRETLAGHLRAEYRRRHSTAAPFNGPVAVMLNFAVRRPASAKHRAYPHTRPDADKQARAVLDALQSAGVIFDDGRVCDLIVTKRFAGVDGPGVRVRVDEMVPSKA